MRGLKLWKKCAAIGLVLIMALTGSYSVPVEYTAYAEEVWIEITDTGGLDAIRNNLTANYKLMADIDLNGVTWTPIGSAESPFTGKLDGNSKIIRNLAITDTTKINQGLFSVVGSGAEISNLGIEGANITAANNTGILAGTNTGTISRCYAKGSVSGQDYVGGLVGQNSGTIQNSYTQASVIGKDYLAGLAGSNSGTVQNSYAASSLPPSVFNNYLEFNGTPVGDYSVKNSGGYIDIPHKDGYVGNQFTLEAWFQWDDVGTSDCNFIVGKGYEQFEIHTGGGSGVNGLRFIPVWNEGGDSHIDVHNVIQPGWFHVAAVYDYNSVLGQAAARVYVNGIAQDLWRGATNLGKTATLNRATNTLGYDKVNGVMVPMQNPMNIGRRTDGWYYFDGKICDVRFWNIARTEQDIKRDKDKVLNGDEAGLVGYWRLNEASGDALDSTVNHNNGTLTGDVVRTSLTAVAHKGGLIGENAGTVTDSYYDSDVSGLSDDTKGIHVATENMKKQVTYANWNNFGSVWGINEGVGYPYLLSTSKDITAFSLQGLSPAVTGNINNNAGTINLTVPFGTNVTALVPTIINTGTSMNPSSGEAKDFTGNVIYGVTAQDGSTKNYTVIVQILEFAGGDGSAENPYQITKLEHLNNIRNHMDKNFILMNDLNFNTDSDYLVTINKAAWTTGSGWLHMGTNVSPFTGVLDGNGHIIRGLYINRTGAADQCTGLLAYSSGLIKNLGLADVNINAYGYAGAYVGWGSGNIDGCFASGSIKGLFAIGGLAGKNEGTITNSYVTACIEGTDNSVSNCIGGIAGWIGETATITNCFSAGKVYGTSNKIGGITGHIATGGSVENCYYNSKVTGLTGGFGTGINTIQMKQQASFASFDFSEIWNIQDSITFPYLRWQTSYNDQAWPAFKEGFPYITNVGGSSMDLHVKSDESGMVHYVVLPAANAAPSEPEIKNGTGSSAATAHGTFDIAADTEAIESINNLPQNNSYKIYIVTEDAAESLQMVPDSLTVNLAASAPIINTQPVSIAGIVGQTATFTVAAAVTLSYQWQKSIDGGGSWNNIDGATSTSYTTGALALSDSGSQYRCAVTITRISTATTSAAATSTAVTTATAVSNAASFTITPAVAPAITGQPQNVTVVEGNTATFTMAASAADDGTITYQWEKSSDNGESWSSIAGAMSPSYTTAALAVGDSGTRYRCAVTNSKNGTTAIATSDAAVLTVNSAEDAEIPTIENQPADVTVNIGEAAVLTVAASGGAELSYQWYGSNTNINSNGSFINGATSNTYSAPTDISGTKYYYCIVTNTDTGATGNQIVSVNSNAAKVTVNPPQTLPGAPTNVTATVGNGQATVSFTPPTDNGGNAITGYTVTSSPGNKTATEVGTTITVTGLSNGTTYTFTVTAVNAAGTGPASPASNAVTPYKPSSGYSGGSNTPSTPTIPAQPVNAGIDILVNGQTATAATTATVQEGDKTVTTVVVDDKKIEERLEQVSSNAVITIPVKDGSDVIVGTLNGQTVKNMEAKEAVLEIKTGNVSYTLPATEINIDDISKQIGSQVELKDIKVSITIAEPTQDTAKVVEDTASKNSYQLVVKPIEFEITCSRGDKTVDVSRFNSYVERTVAIPGGIDPDRITTGVVLNADGSFSHVPTSIVVIDGKYFAKINSLTNSTYSVIYNPKTFKDVENHWAKAAINDMASRLVTNGVGDDNYEPDRDITRAEFVSIVVKALGLLRPDTGKDMFSDVSKDAYYYNAFSIAHEYGIISGYGNGRFGPEDTITREQAMTIIARAMKITRLTVSIESREEEQLLAALSDTGQASGWAKSSIAFCIKAEIVSGRNGKLIAPTNNITRAEVAVIVRKLLQKSGLI